MSTLNAPRYEIPIVDQRTGNMDRNWYKYLALLGNSVGGKTTFDDAQIDEASADSAVTSLALEARRIAKNAESLFLYGPDDPVKREDTSLLAWWPQ